MFVRTGLSIFFLFPHNQHSDSGENNLMNTKRNGWKSWASWFVGTYAWGFPVCVSVAIMKRKLGACGGLFVEQTASRCCLFDRPSPCLLFPFQFCVSYVKCLCKKMILNQQSYYLEAISLMQKASEFIRYFTMLKTYYYS